MSMENERTDEIEFEAVVEVYEKLHRGHFVTGKAVRVPDEAQPRQRYRVTMAPVESEPASTAIERGIMYCADCGSPSFFELSDGQLECIVCGSREKDVRWEGE